jgi:hypothetical protein
MSETSLIDRAARAVLGPPVEWVGQWAEREVRRAVPELPEPPWWAVPVVVVVGVVGAVVVEAVGGGGGRSASERATPEAAPTAERGTTSERDGGRSEAEEIVAALDTLGVEFPPVPAQEAVKAAYRERAVETHPDQGGDAEAFIEVRKAWERLPTDKN